MAVQTGGFAGFEPAALQFLADLATNNERSWFQPRKAEYEALLKRPMEALVEALAERFAARGIPLLAEPRRSVSRIHRDTRFAKDKSPYKTRVYARFPWVGRGGDHDLADEEARSPSGYVHVMPGQSYVGGGLWRPERPRLEAFRQALLDDPDAVRTALERPRFVEVFVSTPVDVCSERDVKGLYAKQKAGELSGLTGVDDPYEPPLDPGVTIPTHELSLEESVELVWRAIS